MQLKFAVLAAGVALVTAAPVGIAVAASSAAVGAAAITSAATMIKSPELAKATDPASILMRVTAAHAA